MSSLFDPARERSVDGLWPRRLCNQWLRIDGEAASDESTSGSSDALWRGPVQLYGSWALEAARTRRSRIVEWPTQQSYVRGYQLADERLVIGPEHRLALGCVVSLDEKIHANSGAGGDGPPCLSGPYTGQGFHPRTSP
jgi:hypothetical protein